MTPQHPAAPEPEVLPCAACPDGHDRLTWHSLGMVCGRCGQHTGNNHQGHYWGLCKVLTARGVPFRDAIRDLHFCCPDNCELEDER